MKNDETIARLSNALAILSNAEFDKELVRALTEDVADEKHSTYIQQGLENNDKGQIMHGIVGMLSHYEAEQEKEKIDRKIHALTKDY